MAHPVPTGADAEGPGAAAAPAQQERGTPARGRGTEMMLLIFATVIVTAAFVLVEANQEQDLSLQIVWYGLAYLGLFAVAHLAVRRWAPYSDPVLLPCVALLNGLGLVMLHRLDLARAEHASEPVHSDAPHQLLLTAVAIVIFAIVLRVVTDHRTLARYGYTCGLVGLALLVLPGVLPYSISGANGAKIFLRIGSFSIQPGEFAKILLIVFFASFLVAKRDLFMAAGKKFLGLELPRLRDLGPLIFALLASIGVLVLEHDLGSSLLIFGVVLVLLYVATERAAWIVIGLVPFIGACVLAYKLFAHVQQRVENWIDPFAHYLDTGYQMAQSLFGLANGGVFGTGLGAGRPDMVPEAATDFIISAFGEELGFVGLTAILVIFLFFTMRGMRNSLAVRDSFGKLLGSGLAFAVSWELFVVVGGATKLIPETGLTTPFMSAGGSSLLANYVLVALLLRISDAARRPPAAGGSRPAMPKVPLSSSETVMVERPS